MMFDSRNMSECDGFITEEPMDKWCIKVATPEENKCVEGTPNENVGTIRIYGNLCADLKVVGNVEADYISGKVIATGSITYRGISVSAGLLANQEYEQADMDEEYHTNCRTHYDIVVTKGEMVFGDSLYASQKGGLDTSGSVSIGGRVFLNRDLSIVTNEANALVIDNDGDLEILNNTNVYALSKFEEGIGIEMISDEPGASIYVRQKSTLRAFGHTGISIGKENRFNVNDRAKVIAVGSTLYGIYNHGYVGVFGNSELTAIGNTIGGIFNTEPGARTEIEYGANVNAIGKEFGLITGGFMSESDNCTDGVAVEQGASLRVNSLAFKEVDGEKKHINKGTTNITVNGELYIDNSEIRQIGWADDDKPPVKGVGKMYLNNVVVYDGSKIEYNV